MNKLEKLIAKLCPNGVEYKPLGEMVHTVSAPIKLNRKDYHESGLYPIVDQGQAFIVAYTNESDALISDGPYVLFGDHTREVKYVDFPFAQGADGVKILRAGEGLDVRYLYYAVSQLKIKSRGYNRHWPIASKMEIPVPPLAVQQEIVRMLDDVAGLIGELEQELAARKQQYEWYERHLLTLEPTLPAKSLIELCNYVDYRGKTPKKTESGVFLVTAKNIRDGYIDYAASQEYIAQEDYSEVMRRGLPEPGDVLITTEAPCGNVAQVDRTDIALAQRVIKYRPKTKELDAAFLKYYMRGKVFQDELTRLATGGTVKGIKGSKLHQMKIVLPPLAEQKKITARLDAFDKLCNSMTEGLPGEIAARKQQYEYYRDRLLDFRRAESGFQDGERRAG